MAERAKMNKRACALIVNGYQERQPSQQIDPRDSEPKRKTKSKHKVQKRAREDEPNIDRNRNGESSREHNRDPYRIPKRDPNREQQPYQNPHLLALQNRNPNPPPPALPNREHQRNPNPQLLALPNREHQRNPNPQLLALPNREHHRNQNLQLLALPNRNPNPDPYNFRDDPDYFPIRRVVAIRNGETLIEYPLNAPDNWVYASNATADDKIAQFHQRQAANINHMSVLPNIAERIQRAIEYQSNEDYQGIGNDIELVVDTRMDILLLQYRVIWALEWIDRARVERFYREEYNLFVNNVAKIDKWSRKLAIKANVITRQMMENVHRRFGPLDPNRGRSPPNQVSSSTGNKSKQTRRDHYIAAFRNSDQRTFEHLNQVAVMNQLQHKEDEIKNFLPRAYDTRLRTVYHQVKTLIGSVIELNSYLNKEMLARQESNGGAGGSRTRPEIYDTNVEQYDEVGFAPLHIDEDSFEEHSEEEFEDDDASSSGEEQPPNAEESSSDREERGNVQAPERDESSEASASESSESENE